MSLLAEVVPEADLLTNGTGLAIAAYAAHQLGKFVVAVTSFLARLEAAWRQEDAHRTSEAEHWKTEQVHHTTVVSLLDKIRAALRPEPSTDP